MIHSRNIQLITLTALIAVGGAAYAGGQGHAQKNAERFKKIDADSNGALTAQEFSAHSQKRFASRDINSDGFIDKDEMRQFIETKKAERVAGMIKAHDTNNDGMLQLAELQSMKNKQAKRAAKMIEKLDTNGDGALDAAELQARVGKGKGMRKKRKFGDMMFGKLDVDSDGKLSFAELHPNFDPAKIIEKLDTDGNGTIDAAEYANARFDGKHRKRKGG